MYEVKKPEASNVVSLADHPKKLATSTTLTGDQADLQTALASEEETPLPAVPETHPISAAFVGQLAYICSFMVDSISYFGPRLQNSPTSRTKQGKLHLAQLNGNFQAMQAAIDAMESWAHEAMPGHPNPLQAMQAAFVELMQKQMAEQAKAQFPEGVLPDDAPADQPDQATAPDEQPEPPAAA